MTDESKPSYTLWQLTMYFLWRGTLGFGGPVALVGFLHRDLVEQRGWDTSPFIYNDLKHEQAHRSGSVLRPRMRN
jgi:hypothetical protein